RTKHSHETVERGERKRSCCQDRESRDGRFGMAEAVRKLNESEMRLYREAPHNIEAEQALLGAILVNNDAFYRVSDFLKPVHFHDLLHRKIFEVAGEMVRMGKAA